MSAAPNLRERQFNFEDGELLLIDKPKGFTSFDVVNKIRFRLRRLLGKKKIKVGHSGTLDPMATGLLIIATGRATKQLTALTGLTKQYTGTIRFGESTPSYDAETEVDKRGPIEHIDCALLQTSVDRELSGEIEQRPPIYSAIKVDGKRAYKHARAGESIELPTRPVMISQFQITDYTAPEAKFLVDCSKGTYIRSLAHDLGLIMDTRAHLSALRRTRIGEYRLEDAFTLEAFASHLDELLVAAGLERPAY